MPTPEPETKRLHTPPRLPLPTEAHPESLSADPRPERTGPGTAPQSEDASAGRRAEQTQADPRAEQTCAGPQTEQTHANPPAERTYAHPRADQTCAHPQTDQTCTQVAGGLRRLLPAPVRRLLPAPSPANARRIRLAISLLPLAFLGVWAAVDWRTVHEGALHLASADPLWLLAGVVFTALCSVSCAFIRQGAVPERLPPGQLLATQFAAGAAGHALPGNIGAHAVVLRFLRARGIPLARCTTSLALYSAVKPVAKTLVILAFLIAFPGTLRLTELLPKGDTLALVGAITGVSLAALVTLITTVRPLRQPLIGGLRTALTDTRLVHSRPVRVIALWGGAAAFPLCQGAVLASVGSSLGLPLSWVQMVFTYLVASTAAGAVPAPGGLGPMDAALVFTLVAFGAPAALATTTVIGYRLLTVWLPLLPGTLVLSALVRAKVL
ncbi:lysylphosphatidylglycerol synthase transmembrane domain-containing protein [Streptomyces sp. NPDC002643]